MFKELIADLSVLAGKPAELLKSEGGDADDANIQAAGATGGDSGDGGEGAAAAAAAAAGAGDDEGDGDPMAKSFEVELEDGKKFQAVDATDLIKSLNSRIEGVEGATGQALSLCVDLIKSQASQIAGLTEAVQKLGATGPGRRAVVAIVQKNAEGTGTGTPLVKSQAAEGIKPQEFLLKAEAAFDAGRLTGRELGLVETTINRNEQMPAALIQKVMAGAGAAA